ncbi:MAG: translation initiation factor IF-2 subunit alpha [Candidatus Diapherotrites archaeon]|mgnify:CR=1 FL=1|nr:translation initiation factor IF-2 subunit alpha [Candidatus Diapherotrites archaeon]
MPEWPEIGEIVVVKVTKVLPYGAFVELLEYDNLQGFIHISQVASRWVKNIRNYVRPNQIRAAQVIHIDRNKHQIDLSLTKVSEAQERAKIEEWELSKRSRKLLEVFAKQQKKPFKTVWKEVAEPLLERYNNLMDAFQEALLEGENALQGIPKSYVKPLLAMLEKSIEIPKKRVRGVLKIKSYEPYALDTIKNALIAGLKEAKDAEVTINYAGGGKYVVTSTAYDYKTAERNLRAVSEKVMDEVKKAKGMATFEKVE